MQLIIKFYELNLRKIENETECTLNLTVGDGLLFSYNVIHSEDKADVHTRLKMMNYRSQ